MSTAEPVPPQVRNSAWLQAGVVTRRQALEAGMSSEQVRGLVGSGRWRRLARGVYATDQPVWYQAAWAGLLMAGGGSCLGGRAAAFLHGFGRQPRWIDIWVPPGTAVPRSGAGGHGGGPSPEPGAEGIWAADWRFHQGSRTVVGTPPRSCVEETVLDLCEEKLARHFKAGDPYALWNERTYPALVRGRVRAVVTEALDSGMTTVDRLVEALGRFSNLEGRRLVEWELREIAADRPIAEDGPSLYRRQPPGEPRMPVD